jgi:penicillin V acylase-like amidase (Ntn superfamily)
MLPRASIRLFLICLAFSFTSQAPGFSCTIFTVARGGKVLVGNNEDWRDKKTRMWFVPGGKETLGVVYFGFDNLFPQGGMNEHGLFFDANALPFKDITAGKDRPRYDGDLMSHIMQTCSTVQEAINELSSYDFSHVFARGQFQIADSSGDAAVLEGDAIIRKKNDFIISTNFRQSEHPDGKWPCLRFKRAEEMLKESAGDASLEFCVDILEATAQLSTQYSNVYDLKNRMIYIYHFHDFQHMLKVDLKEELRKGYHVEQLPSLFPLKEEFGKETEWLRFDGTYTLRYRNGNPRLQVTYVNDEPNGRYVEWDRRGKVLIDVELEKGKVRKK